MKVTIDATPLLMRSAGVKGYLFHWIRALRRAAPPGAILTFPEIENLDSLNHEQSVLGRARTIGWLGAVGVAQRLGIRVASARGAKVFHCSNQIRRIPDGCRVTATLHDLTSWIMPELNTAANVRADFDFTEHVLCRADAVIAVSENTRRDAIRRLNIKPHKIATIRSGVAAEYFDVTGDDAARSASALGLSKPYVLCVGTIEPRKNIDRLLDAWELLPRDVRESHELVFAGPGGWKSGRTMARLQAMAGVRYLGYVAESLLPGLTRGASVLAYPSLYEGFGFPVAQAMAAGTAVVTSETSCLPEVTGGAASYVDPLSVTDITMALRRLLESPSERDRLAEAGRLAAERYRWERCAQESLAFFQRLS